MTEEKRTEVVDDGGPAFPSMSIKTDLDRDNPQSSVDTYSHGHAGGMTLRDYFAAKALSGIVSDGYFEGQNYEDSAKAAYAYADAMLAARKPTAP